MSVTLTRMYMHYTRTYLYAIALPTEPQQVTIVSTLTTSLRLTWSEPAESYGQRVLFYNVNCTSATHTVTVERVYNTTVNVSGLTPNSNYTCCVSASNQAGEGNKISLEALTKQGSVLKCIRKYKF